MKKIFRFSLTTGFFLVASVISGVSAKTDITFAYVGDTSHSAYLGIQQGIREANLQGQFLGQNYTIISFGNVMELPVELESILAIFVASTEEELMALREISSEHPIFNLIARNNSLRSACLGNVLHTIPSEKMLEDAVAQWRQKDPTAMVLASAWHGDFVKFAARDLNKRFRKAFDRDMDDYAWAAWAAVKMTADTVARENITDPSEMLDYLKNKLAFDGQKGVSMSFRETGQLRQPILLGENDKLLGEAPVRGVSSSIDSLGITECSK